MRKLCDESDLLKRRGLTNCNLKVITLKIADAQCNFANLVAELHRNTVSPYDSIRCSLDGTRVGVGKRRKKNFDRKECSLQ